MASLLHSLTTGDAEGVSASLSVLSPSTSTASTFSPSDERSIRSLVDASPSSIDARWCDVLCGAGSSRAAVSRGEFAAAYGAHTKMFGAFMGVWKDAGDDDVPSLIRAMSTVTTEHRQLARAADRYTVRTSARAVRPSAAVAELILPLSDGPAPRSSTRPPRR